jgi:hypothetical protein
VADTSNIVVDQPGQDMAAVNTAPGVTQEDTEFAHLNHSDALDVAAASWRQNTILGTVWNHLGHVDLDAEHDPTFNPYAYIKEHESEYKDIIPLVAQGSEIFDRADSKRAFDLYVAAQRQNLKDRETIANGDAWGTVLGLGASMLDVTALASLGGLAFKGAAAATTLGRMGIGAGIAGIDQGINEAVSHQLDDTRTAEESFMNIGTGVALGGALGPIFVHAKPDNPLNPGHPDNPLHPDNLDNVHPVNEHYVGQVPEEGDSIGAMRATRGNEANEIAKGKGKIAQAIDWALASRFTPLGRLTNYKSPAAREGLLSMYDTGGILTRAMAEGEARPVEAETIKTIFDQRAQAVRNDVAQIYRQANVDLGQSAVGADLRGVVNTITLGGKDINTVPQQAFNEAITLIQHGSNAGAPSSQISQDVMDHLVASGLTPDQAKLVHKRVYEAEARYHQAYEDVWNEAVRIGLADPKTAVEGRYGMPQLWDRERIDADAMGFKAIMHQHLGTKPTEDWLREEGWIKDPNKPATAPASGEKAVEIPYSSWDDIVNSGDKTLQNDILNHWRGEEQAFQNDYLQAQLQAAEQRQLKAQEDAAELLKQLGKAETEHTQSRLSEMRAAARHAERHMVAQRLGSAQLKAEKAEAKVKAVLARTGGDPDGIAADLQQALRDNGFAIDRQGPKIPEAEARVSEADALVASLKGKKAENVEARAGLTEDTPERRQLRRDSRKINQDLRDAIKAHQDAQVELRDANASLDRLAKEQRNSQKWLEAVAKDVETMKANEAEALLDPGLRAANEGQADRLAYLKQKLDEATQARRAAYAARRQLGQDARAAAKESGRAAAALRKTAFKARKYTSDTSPLVKYVDQLANNLRGNERAPRGLLLDEAPTTGRLKERKFQFNNDEYRQLREAGFLKSNADDAFMGYHQDLGGHIAVHRAMGGRKMEDVMREVQEDYDRMIGSEADPKKREQLKAEAKSALDDLQAARDRILGKYDPKDHNGLVWTADMVKKLGIVRYMGGFIFSSIGDIAQAAFAAPGSVLKTIAFKGARDYSYILKKAAEGDADMKELERILGSFETGLHMNMSDKALGRGAVRDYVGFGSGMTRDLSGKAEKLFDVMADAGNKLSGLKAWSDNIRRTAGLVQLANIREWVGSYAKLNASKRAQLAVLGIGEAEAKRLNELFAKYGTEQRRGLFSPGMSKWLDEPDGEAMKYVLESALVKAQKRASYTSGYGNQPLLMDKWYGKLFLQFQSQAFQFTNNFLRAGFQHGAVTGDQWRFASALGTALAAGVLMNAIATFRKGEDIQKQLDNPEQFAYNVIQRSSLLGWAGSYVDAGVKLMDPVLQKHAGFTLGGGASKYSQNSWLANLIGPWGGNIETLQQIGANAVNGDFDKMGKKALLLAPLNQQMSIVGRIVSTLNN